MLFDTISDAATARHLTVLGGLHPKDRPNIGTLLLLGPHEPEFWPQFQRSPEATDAQPDPMDRWSKRVVTALAADLGAEAVFPFGGPPFEPFIAWALQTGRIWTSPVGLLVHDRAGLFVSFRGALAFRDHIPLPKAPRQSPCDSCASQPCKDACPVEALQAQSYDVAACKSHLRTAAGASCLEAGCLARRACPLSATYGRLEAQSAFHMKAFL
ncbi:MAG: ferredoxin [Thalassovita sp.]